MVVKQFSHDTVLLNEAVAALVTDPAGVYVDGTFGRGGHSQAILGQLNQLGRLIAFDKDPAAVAVGNELAEGYPGFQIVHASFSELRAQLNNLGLSGEVAGVLLDLGVSSPQLDDAARGFSFMQDGPLDMRMNNQAGERAADWLNRAEASEIARVLKEYGEERFARRIAQTLIEFRQQQPITTTGQLAELITRAIPVREKNKHPATRSFQAIRIFINKELDDLTAVLEQSLNVLKTNGRLVVISFHSLEDRIVKRFIRSKERGQPLPRHLPVQDEAIQRQLKTVQKSTRASTAEIADNARSRSAIMRVAEKL